MRYKIYIAIFSILAAALYVTTAFAIGTNMPQYYISDFPNGQQTGYNITVTGANGHDICYYTGDTLNGCFTNTADTLAFDLGNFGVDFNALAPGETVYFSLIETSDMNDIQNLGGIYSQDILLPSSLSHVTFQFINSSRPTGAQCESYTPGNFTADDNRKILNCAIISLNSNFTTILPHLFNVAIVIAVLIMAITLIIVAAHGRDGHENHA